MTNEPLPDPAALIRQAQEARRAAEDARERAKALSQRLGQLGPLAMDVGATRPPLQRAVHWRGRMSDASPQAGDTTS